MHAIDVSANVIFQSLSDDTRIRILRLLIDSEEEACLCELVDSLHEPSYKLSKNLKVLRQTGLLTSQKDGKWVYHRIVNTVGFLRKLHGAIAAIPDVDGIFAKDLKRFQKRLGMREGGRCRLGVQTAQFAAAN